MYSNNKFAKMDSIANLIKTILEADTKAKMEELKGGQHKIDKNKNNKIDAQDFKILRGEKKVEESSHQAKTTMKHVKNPTAGEKAAAKDIKPGIAGYRDRIDMLKSAEARGGLKKEEAEQVDEAGVKEEDETLSEGRPYSPMHRIGRYGSTRGSSYLDLGGRREAPPASKPTTPAPKPPEKSDKEKEELWDYMQRKKAKKQKAEAMKKEENEYDNMSDKELEKHIDDLRERANALKDKAKTSKSAKAKYYELVKQHHEASQKLYGIDEAKEPGFRASYGIGRKGSTAKKATQASGRKVQGRGYDSEGNERKAPEGHAPVTSLMPGHDERAARFLARQAKGKVVKGKAQSAPQKEEVEQIDEIGDTPAGRQMLGRYIKKAARRVGVHSAIATDYSTTADDETASPAQRMAAKTLAAKQKNRRDMRLRGVERATNRLTQEDAEQIDEISQGLKGRVQDARRGQAVAADLGYSPRPRGYEAPPISKATQNRLLKRVGGKGNELYAKNVMASHLDKRSRGDLKAAESYAGQDGEQIDEMKAGASAGNENKFHKKLDKLVHGTFGASSDEKKMKKEEIDPKKTVTDTLKGREKTSDNPFLSKKVMLDVPGNVKEESEQVYEGWQIVAQSKQGETFKSGIHPTKEKAMSMHYKMSKSGNYKNIKMVGMKKEEVDQSQYEKKK